LGEVPTSAASEMVPGKGLLYFFYDSAQSTWGLGPKDKDGWQVIYCDEAPAERAITEYPNDIPDRARFTEMFVRCEAASSIPDVGEIVAADQSIADEQAEKMFDIFGEYEQRRIPIHQLLGHPAEIQGWDMRLMCQLASHGLYCGNSSGYNDPRAKELEPGAAEWRLLLQIDSDDDVGMVWGDSGRLYFWIHKDDLKNRKFERTWMVLECY
ncbi:MAG: YwqG family protein, partial [Planctomycetota bacterium]